MVSRETRAGHVPGYADDLAMVSYTADQQSERLTRFADGAIRLADMHINPSKTFTQHVQVQPEVEAATTEELTKVQGNEIISKMEYIIYYVRNKAMRFFFHLYKCLKYTAQ